MAEKLVEEKEIVGKEEEEVPYRRTKLGNETVADRRKTIEGPRVTLEYKHVIVPNVTTNTISDTLNEYAAAGWRVEHMSYGFGGVPLGAAILFKREKFS